MRFAPALAALTVAIPALAAPGGGGGDPTRAGIGYICAAESHPAEGKALTLVKGVGSGGFPADTRSAEAQAWFDYGLQLFHAFYHDEAKVAFKRAAEADPSCSLCAWGEALSLGPTLNYDISHEDSAKALAVADRAAGLAKDERTKALTAVLQARYRPHASPAERELSFGRAMADLSPQWPGNDDVPALAAEAMLTPARGANFAGVNPAIQLLEGILKRDPNNTAAIHYYIHATEFGAHPELATSYAERLASLAPEASHLVHMGGHTLFRVGRYEEVAVLNAGAMKTDVAFAAEEGVSGPISRPRYYLHNSTFGLAGALIAGDAKLALRYADHMAVAFPVGSPADRRATAIGRSYIAYGRFAPAKALALGEQPGDNGYVRMMRHYARGEAFAGKGDLAGVGAEAAAIRAMKPGPAEGGLENQIAIAAAVLEGRAAMLKGDYSAAAKAFGPAADLQDRIYASSFDPPPWWYPVRRSLAAADLAGGKPQDALRELQISLKHWPQDALSLRVLSQAEAKLGDAQAQVDAIRARRAWRGNAPMPKIQLI